MVNTAAALVDQEGRCTFESRSVADDELERLVVSGVLRRSEHVVIGADHLPSYELAFSFCFLQTIAIPVSGYLYQ